VQLAIVGNELPDQPENNIQLGKLGKIMRVQLYFVSLWVSGFVGEAWPVLLVLTELVFDSQ